MVNKDAIAKGCSVRLSVCPAVHPFVTLVIHA